MKMNWGPSILGWVTIGYTAGSKEKPSPNPSFSHSDPFSFWTTVPSLSNKLLRVMGQDQVCALWGLMQRGKCGPLFKHEGFQDGDGKLSQEGVPLSIGPCAQSPAQEARNPSQYPGRSWHVVGSEGMWPLTLHPALSSPLPPHQVGAGAPASSSNMLHTHLYSVAADRGGLQRP